MREAEKLSEVRNSYVEPGSISMVGIRQEALEKARSQDLNSMLSLRTRT